MLNNIIKKIKVVKSRFLSGKKSKLFIAVLILNSTVLIHNCFAQNIGISATGATPDNSAMLDVVSNTKGMLIPRMTGAEKYAIPTPATGLLIFQTDTVGFWYYDGTKWIPLVSSTSSTASPTNAGWLTTGNIGTAWNKNFLGTTDNVSLRLRTNNTEKMIIDSLGRVGIGTTAPAYKLQVTNNDTSTISIVRPNIYSVVAPSSAANSASNFFGTWNQVQPGSIFNFTGSLYGSISRVMPTASQTGTLQNTHGSQSDVLNQGTGTISAAWGLKTYVSNTSTGTITTAYGIESQVNNSGGGTITNGYGILISNVQATNKWSIYASDGTAPSYFAGNVGIGTTSPSQKLHVVGNICYTGSIGACSDIRYKKDITPLSHALDKVLSMQGVNYHWKTKEFPEKQFTEGNQIGFIAQKLEKIIPEVVMTDKDGYKSVDYSRLTPVLVEAIKELKKENDSLKSENGSIKSEMENMKAEIEKIKSALNTTIEAKK